MVLFRANEKHLFKCMQFMNELRKNGTFCDISLIVGSQVLKAHRCVLAAGSEYFNVLFLGQFAEATMSEINLSEVTKDIKSLEMMVNFLYTGEIDINTDNLDIVVKLSSYFIMETVVTFCKRYMIDTLSLQTCLRYYLCATEHGLTSVIDETSQMVTVRFHDCLILEQETLEVSPKELLYLHQNEVLQFCTPHDLLKFVVDWAKIGITEQHISVGTEILDSVTCIEDNASLPLMHSRKEALSAACEEMIATVNKVRLEGSEEFVHRASILRDQCIQNRESKRKYNLRVRPLMAKFKSSTRTDVDKENVLITLPSRYQAHPKRSSTMFDICAYVPSTRCWYYLKKMDTQDDLVEVLDDKSKYDWEFTMRHDQLVLAYSKKLENAHVEDGITLHDLNGEIWGNYAFAEQVNTHLKGNESWENNQFRVVTGTNNDLYIIAVISFTDDENPLLKKIFFRGFKFQDSDQSWHISFQTEKYQLAAFDLDRSFRGQKHDLDACISTVSNEMLVTYSEKRMLVPYSNKRVSCRSIVFLVNLNSETPVPVSILDSGDTLDYSDPVDLRFGSEIIVLGKKQFFILYDYSRPIKRRFLEVKFEVMYNSNKLTTVETNTVELDEVTEIIYDTAFGPSIKGFGLIWMEWWRTSDRESMWYVCGNYGVLSKLVEVTVSSNCTPVIKSHPPPPFTSITAAFAGTVSKDVLRKFKPVSFFGWKFSEKSLMS